MTGIQTSAPLSVPKNGRQGMQQTIPQQRQHPRRTPPRNVIPLPGSKRQKLSHSPNEIRMVDAGVTRLKSQGSGSDQSANQWFDSANRHIAQSAKGNTGYDDEPPFFIGHQKSYVPNSFDPSEAGGSRMFGAQSRLDSENEDLRGIVDDLTVENRRLKQILRLNQKSQRDSPKTETSDKLFEVRMHGLPPDKRRELEYLLKNFATSVHTSVPSIPNSPPGSGTSSNSVGLHNGKVKTDSGYASNSNSGRPSSMSHTARGALALPPVANDKNINKYLQDIPDTLMPRQQPIVMSERSKMALVVRRLEQLFTGKTASPGEHSQPLQQQEVSQMAARADSNNSKKRKIEGSREAHILPPDSKVNFDAVDVGSETRKKLGPKTSNSDLSISEDTSLVVSRPDSPDQRPTRPLDLDIHRAQVAAENIEYIRHLGLSSPHLDSHSTNESWMYLNLLINMAQMHTISVTPDFVRKSIKKMSTKFELSKDGHRVRWIGGPEGTVFSKEEEKALEATDNHNKENSSTDELNDDTRTGSSRRSKTDSNSNAVVSNTTSEEKISGMLTSTASKHQISTGATSNQLSSLQIKPTETGSAFDYKPVVYRVQTRIGSPDESYLDSDSSLEGTSRDSSGLVHALSRSNLREKRKSDEGIITFYNHPFYCSDFSGDTRPSNMLTQRDAIPGLVLGIDPGNLFEVQTSRLAEACYFTPQFGPPPFSPPQNESLPTLQLAPLSTAENEEIQPMEFVVSGHGGVTLNDNFAIDVDIHMTELPTQARQESAKRVPFTGTEISPRYGYTLGYSNKIDLIVSRLPPATYVLFTSSSSSGNQMDDDDESDLSSDDESSYSGNGADPTPPSFLQHRSTDDSGLGDVDEDDHMDDSSVDMLATARAVDPVLIAEQERQYLINEPGGRAVAGSLAATVGASQSSINSNAGGDNDHDIDDGDDVASNEPEVVSEDEYDDSEVEVDDD